MKTDYMLWSLFVGLIELTIYVWANIGVVEADKFLEKKVNRKPFDSWVGWLSKRKFDYDLTKSSKQRFLMGVLEGILAVILFFIVPFIMPLIFALEILIYYPIVKYKYLNYERYDEIFGKLANIGETKE